MCANKRKGHFEGVLEVMDRLLNLIKPKFLYLGEKDFQQQYLIQKYLHKKHMFKLIICKTIRHNKMALSSRNLNLKKKSLKTAQLIAGELSRIKNKYKNYNFRNIHLKSKIQDGLIDTDKTKFEWKNLAEFELLQSLIFRSSQLV